MKIAVASLGNFHANPYGPELQVKQMLERRLRRAKKKKEIVIKSESIVSCTDSMDNPRGKIKILSQIVKYGSFLLFQLH